MNIGKSPYDPPGLMSAGALADRLKNGELSAAELMEACLDRIAARDPEVGAWAFIDFENARAQARRADEHRATGRPLEPLHGLPVGVKDVFDTADMPSEYGSETLRGRRPDVDAAAVSVLRKAGAIIVGKTTTSEFGMYHPSVARNPRDLSRSPGVSSAGSAAAVVDQMVPLALGTQHTASTTLPASFCGAFAFKPSFGFTSMAGSNVLVPRLAHLGLFATSVSDLSLFAGAFELDARRRVSSPAEAASRRGQGAGLVDGGRRRRFRVRGLRLRIAGDRRPRRTRERIRRRAGDHLRVAQRASGASLWSRAG